MNKIISGFALAATFVLAPALQAATVEVDVDGLTDASETGATVGVDVMLDAGTYKLTFIDRGSMGGFTAFNRFGSVSGCDGNGENCARGWENSARYIIDPTTFLFGDGLASGGIGPIAGGGYFDSAMASFTNSAAYVDYFTLASAETVRFFLFDDNIGDNVGGVSLSVEAVPLPAAAWLFGSVILGLVGMARRKQV